MKPRLLDAFCCAGGATRGYQLAGFHVTGVDIEARPDYCGDEFVQTDAVEFIREHGHEFDVIHASPPCQAYCTLTRGTHRDRANHFPKLIEPTRDVLVQTDRPFVIENVPPAPIRHDLVLCGDMFGLDVQRHRAFEIHGPLILQPPHTRHRGFVQGWRHGVYRDGPYVAVYGDGGGKGSIAEWQRAMGIDWITNRTALAEAIPPAYTRYIGEALAAATYDQAA